MEEISDETYWERRERLMRKFANDPNEHNRAAAVDLAVEFATAGGWRRLAESAFDVSAVAHQAVQAAIRNNLPPWTHLNAATSAMPIANFQPLRSPVGSQNPLIEIRHRDLDADGRQRNSLVRAAHHGIIPEAISPPTI